MGYGSRAACRLVPAEITREAVCRPHSSEPVSTQHCAAPVNTLSSHNDIIRNKNSHSLSTDIYSCHFIIVGVMGGGASAQKAGVTTAAERSEFASHRDNFHKVSRTVFLCPTRQDEMAGAKEKR